MKFDHITIAHLHHPDGSIETKQLRGAMPDYIAPVPESRPHAWTRDEDDTAWPPSRPTIRKRRYRPSGLHYRTEHRYHTPPTVVWESHYWPDGADGVDRLFSQDDDQ